MSDQNDQTPYYQGGQYGRSKDEGCDPPPPPPPPPPCPEPCDQDPPWGPPDIRPECCPHDRGCCPNDQHCCTWYEVEDPCVRASSCGGEWTKIDCKCYSSNEKCDCEEWDCSCYPKGGCVPCKPCDGLLPEGDGPTGGCDDPGRDDCTTADLRKQLDALTQCISSREGEKAKIDADIKARAERAKALADLIKGFDDIAKNYNAARQQLICSEDCLKGFYRDTSRIFQDKHKFPEGCLEKLQQAINTELCKLETEKCCQKNLEGKLDKVTKLVWEKQQADKVLTTAEDAFKSLQGLGAWIGGQFKVLDGLTKDINTALYDNDPNKHKWAFYLFYWKFVPTLCKCFPVAFCCHKKDDSEKTNEGDEKPTDHIGCKPGDWHPSVITVEKLNKLICCAWDYVREQKENAQAANDRLEQARRNLDYIKKKVTADEGKALEENIQSSLNKVECKPASSGK